MQLGSGSDAKDTCKRMLMFWCLQAPTHRTKLGHSAVALTPSDALPLEILNSRLSELPAPPAVVQTDEEINAASHGPERGTRAVAKSKAKSKAKGKATPKPKAGKAKAKSKPSAAPAPAMGEDEAASDPESSSSSSSSDSDSSSSSRSSGEDHLSSDS